MLFMLPFMFCVWLTIRWIGIYCIQPMTGKKSEQTESGKWEQKQPPDGP